MTTAPNRCTICDAQTKATFCATCMPLARRRFAKHRGRKRDRAVQVPTRAEWLAALRAAWDPQAKRFRCGIWGVRLDRDVPALYPTLDHADPSLDSGGWLVVAAAVNDMKSDITLEEARRAWALLAASGPSNVEVAAELEEHLSRLAHFKPRAAVKGG